MPKKFKDISHLLKPDPRYKDRMVGKFINCLMWNGEKVLAQRIFYSALEEVQKKVPGVEPIEVFRKAIQNLRPHVEVRSRRVGGATYQVPVEVPAKRQTTLSYRWLIEAARKKKGRPMANRLADEISAAYKGEGEAMSFRENVHKMAEANKAFAHYAW
jgi:small subunit ribosomal protein S7